VGEKTGEADVGTRTEERRGGVVGGTFLEATGGGRGSGGTGEVRAFLANNRPQEGERKRVVGAWTEEKKTSQGELVTRRRQTKLNMKLFSTTGHCFGEIKEGEGIFIGTGKNNEKGGAMGKCMLCRVIGDFT